MSERFQLIAKAKAIHEDFKNITAPLVKKKFLQYKEIVFENNAIAKVGLSKKEVASLLTYLSEVERRIFMLSCEAQECDLGRLRQIVKLMEYEAKEIESAKPRKLLEKCKYAKFEQLLPLYRLAGNASKLFANFVWYFFGEKPAFVYNDENDPRIYIQTERQVQEIGKIEEVISSIPQEIVHEKKLRLIEPVIDADYDFESNLFVLRSLKVTVGAYGSQAPQDPISIMENVSQQAGVAFEFFVKNILAAAQSIGIKIEQFVDRLSEPSSYYFQCRTPSQSDDPPSMKNNFRQAVFEARLSINAPTHFPNVEGRILLPEKKILITANGKYYERRTFVYDHEKKAFISEDF
ncbi:MAG: hypothetical protein N3G80_03785 [Candidatus Micrarchaeota archaeon]|nr:hypothetical protein [Candidatus Micrarchaeota archaeon]